MHNANAIPIESAYGNIPGFVYFDISVETGLADEQGHIAIRRYPLPGIWQR